MLRNDRLMVENLSYPIGQQICINDVLMIGTQDYTAIGRPQVQNARVFATVEEQSDTEKVIIFKKRRRKGYQKSQGHRQTVSVLKIDWVEHAVDHSAFSSMSQEGELEILKKPEQTYNQII